VLALALLAVVVLVALRVAGPVQRSGRVARAGVFGSAVLSAQEHRVAADAAAADGRWQVAVQERFRAVVRSLEERALVDARPGATADEVAAQAASALPDLAADLSAAARLFDDVTYGHHGAAADSDVRLRELDAAVASARPAAGARL
jgi:hypothetical protein